MTVTVFTGPGCGGCIAAKAQLKKRNVPFEEVPAAEYADVLTSLNLTSLPVILAGDEDVISGFAVEEIDWMIRNVVAA